MIKFPCKCGFRFELPDDQAGGLVQCGQCGLLADVPSLNDIGSLHEDGTFAFETPTHVVDTTTVADRARIFGNQTTDAWGNQKDLRSSVDDLRLVGEDQPVRIAPRYDPETGELIRAIPLKDEEPVSVILLDEADQPVPQSIPQPMSGPISRPGGTRVKPGVAVPVIPVVAPGRVKSLGYAADADTRAPTAMTLIVDLFQPGNMAVLIFVYFGTLIGRLMLFAETSYTERFFSTVWPFLVVDLPMWLIVSHLGVVVESTGPDATDELPRPLGNFEIWDDIFSPFLRTAMAGLICFAPTMVVVGVFSFTDPAAWVVAIFVYLAGCAFFPAVLLTAVAGTTVLNLRPDRVLSVIRQSGLSYAVSVLLGFVTVSLGTFYLAGDMIFPQQLDKMPIGLLEHPFAVMTLSAEFVIFLHWFGWHLGLIYRGHHEDYPWLAQRHVKRPRPAVRA